MTGLVRADHPLVLAILGRHPIGQFASPPVAQIRSASCGSMRSDGAKPQSSAEPLVLDALGRRRSGPHGFSTVPCAISKPRAGWAFADADGVNTAVARAAQAVATDWGKGERPVPPALIWGAHAGTTPALMAGRRLVLWRRILLPGGRSYGESALRRLGVEIRSRDAMGHKRAGYDCRHRVQHCRLYRPALTSRVTAKRALVRDYKTGRPPRRRHPAQWRAASFSAVSMRSR